jgi:HSP20 family protein
MKLPGLWSSQDEASRSFRREVEDMFRTFGQNIPALSVGANVPVVSIAETSEAIEATIELPGVEEKDIKINLDGNRLVISGEKKEESTKDEKDWHVEERSYGTFYRAIALPFTPEDRAVEAHLDKGVLHVVVKKPTAVARKTKTIEIKTVAPPKA